MNYLKVSLGIFVTLAASRFIPHPPNFTSLIALSFYIPAIIGSRFIPIVLTSFVITDIFLGFHSYLFFTWASIVIIGFVSNYFKSKMTSRFLGVFIGAWIFYLFTNFGVWLGGSIYEYTLDGLVMSYTLALPFFYNTLVSTLIYSFLIYNLQNL